MLRRIICPALGATVPMLPSQPAAPFLLILKRSMVQLVRPPAFTPFLAMPWMLRSCSHTLLEERAYRPTRAHGIVLVQSATACEWVETPAPAAVSLRLPP